MQYNTQGQDLLRGTLNPFDLSFNWFFFNPKVGAQWRWKHAGETTIYAGITHREPTRASLLTALDRNPLPERLFNIELGHNIERANWMAAVNLFYMAYQKSACPDW